MSLQPCVQLRERESPEKLRIVKKLDFRSLYMLYKFTTNLDEETRRYFHPPIIYPYYKNPLSLANYMRLFISVIISKHVLLKILPRLACITVIAKLNQTIGGFSYLIVKQSLKNCYESELGIVVDKKFRKKGIGSMLVRTLIDEAIKTDVIKKINLTVLKENIPAINLYCKHGFKIVKETTDSFYGKDLNAFKMELYLFP